MASTRVPGQTHRQPEPQQSLGIAKQQSANFRSIDQTMMSSHTAGPQTSHVQVPPLQLNATNSCGNFERPSGMHSMNTTSAGEHLQLRLNREQDPPMNTAQDYYKFHKKNST